MQCTGKLKSISLNYITKRPEITLEINENTNFEEIQNIEKLNIEIKKYRKKRSKDANNYFWKLLQDFCDVADLDALEEYKRRVRELGIFRRYRVETENLETMKKTWENWGVAWWVEVADTEYLGDIEFKMLHLYYGSSSYDSKQMSRLIDGLVQDCKAIGVPTKSQEEIDSLIKEWGKR